MQVKTKANLISYYDDSFIGRDGNPVTAYKVQVGKDGEAAIDLPLDEEAFKKLIAAKAGYTVDVPFTLEIRKYGNKVSVRCVDVL